MEKYYVNYGPHYELELLSADEIKYNQPERYCTASVHLDEHGADDIYNGTVKECEEYCAAHEYVLGKDAEIAIIEVGGYGGIYTHDVIYEVDWYKENEEDEDNG